MFLPPSWVVLTLLFLSVNCLKAEQPSTFSVAKLPPGSPRFLAFAGGESSDDGARDGGSNHANARTHSDGLVDSSATDAAKGTIIVEGMVRGFLNRTRLRTVDFKCMVEAVEGEAIRGHPAKDVVPQLSFASPGRPSNAAGVSKPPKLPLACDVMSASAECVRLLRPMLFFNDTVPNDTANTIVLPRVRTLIIQIVRLQGRLAERCVRGDALDALHLASSHLNNMTYIGGRLVANGADILTELAAAIQAFEHGDLAQFGENFGKAWRKVLLARVGAGSPSPTPKAIEEMSDGLVQGFFGPGSGLVVTADLAPSSQGKELHVHLRSCVSGNVEFFQTVWSATWLFFAQMAAANRTLLANGTTAGKDKRWQGPLAAALLEMPKALQHCNIPEKGREMLLDSLQALGKLHLRVDLSEKQLQSREISVNLESAVQDWSRGRWHNFGKNLGKLLQQLVLLVFPQQYSVDGAQHLKKQLMGLASRTSMGHGQASAAASIFGNGFLASSVSILTASFAAVSLLVGIPQLFRRMRSSQLRESDVEWNEIRGEDLPLWVSSDERTIDSGAGDSARDSCGDRHDASFSRGGGVNLSE